MNSVTKRFSLKGKIILLTGASGMYGRCLAADIAASGALLVVASRDLSACRKVADQECKRGFCVEAEQLDQSDEQSILGLRSRLLERYGRVDGLVNNSASRPMVGPEDQLSAQFAESMRVNATGLYLMHRYFGECMAERGSGSIVNIGSIQGNVGPSLALYEGLGMPPPPVDYFFHKGGMVNLTRYFAAIHGGRGVRVNTVSAGGFFSGQNEQFVCRYNAQTMLGRMAGPDDLGGPVIFLLSDAAGYVTGANIAVDGGYTAE